MNEDSIQITIAIESAINGGSLALFRGSDLIDEMTGATALSRAEDLLPNIEILLTRNTLTAREVTQVITGAGPGSFTGIRIGLATAIGFATAVNAEFRSVSTLEVMAHASGSQSPLTCALPVGRGTICFQQFGPGLTPTDDPQPIATADFTDLLSNGTDWKFVVNDSMAADLLIEATPDLVRVSDGLATLIGRFGPLIADSPPLFIAKQK